MIMEDAVRKSAEALKRKAVETMSKMQLKRPGKSRTLVMPCPEDWPQMELALRLLCLREEGEWHAICLDMDLEAYAPTAKEALEELQDLITGQIKFAMQKRDPGLILHSAEAYYLVVYEETRKKALERRLASPSQPLSNTLDALASAMRIPEELVAEYQNNKNGFKLQGAA